MSENKEKTELAKKLYAERLCGPDAAAKRAQFVKEAREGVKPFLDAVRAAEQITAEDRRVYINARSND